ncbi:MAG: hypothetical protein R3B97_10410 [Dehalococcoidia bacterium]
MAVPVRAPGSAGGPPGRLIEWYRPDGADLHEGDPVACVECDDIVFDLDAESDGVLHHRAVPGDAPLPSNVVAFIAAHGEAPPLVAEPDPEPLEVTPPPAAFAPLEDHVPGAPIPLRRGALGAPKEFTRGGAWDRVFGSSDDGHIDDLWPNTDAEHVHLHPAREHDTADPGRVDSALDAGQQPLESISGSTPPQTGDDTMQPVEEFAYFDSAAAGVQGDPVVDAPADTAPPVTAPGIEVAPAEVFGSHYWPHGTVDDESMPLDTAGFEGPAPWGDPASVYIAPPPLVLRGTIKMTEARKLCDQLGREWREAPARPENEDLVLRAIARAAAERELAGDDGGIAGLVIPLAGGDRIAILRGAARGSFKEQVARLDQSSRDATYADCEVTLVSFRHFGIEEATPFLPEGHSVAFAMGALRPGTNPEGDVPLPVMVLTMVYNPDALSMGDAALLFARTGELIEAPYALLAD